MTNEGIFFLVLGIGAIAAGVAGYKFQECRDLRKGLCRLEDKLIAAFQERSFLAKKCNALEVENERLKRKEPNTCA